MIEQIKQSSLLRWLIPLTMSLITATGFGYLLSFWTTNVFYVIFPILLYPMYQKAMLTSYSRKIRIASVICGILFMLFLWLKKFPEFCGSEEPTTMKSTFIIFGLFFFFSAASAELYQRMTVLDWNTAKPKPSGKKTALIFISSLVLIELVWLPYFLYLYPGEVTPDSIAQLNQAEGNFPLSNHHPIAHTFMIKILFEFGLKLFGNDNAALAFYSVCQSILLASCFAYLIATLYQFGFRKRVLLGILLYAFLPYHACYSVTMWKDIWFGGIMLAFGITLWRFFIWSRLHKEQKKLPVFESVMLSILGIGICLFRSNGLYAYIFFLFFLILYHIRKKQFKLIGICTVSLIVSLVIKGPVYRALNVTPPDTIESLSIPAQHIAAALHNDHRILTPEQYALLSQIVVVEKIPERYVADISDSIKNLVRETDNQEFLEEHKLEFLKLWISLGLQYPDIYLKAQIAQTFGYFYPDVQYWVYPGDFRSDNFNIYKDRKLSPETADLIQASREIYRTVPYLGLFWSIGLMTWITIFMCGAAFMKKPLKFSLIYLPAIGVILTLMIATPVYAEFRYAYCIFTSMPLFCCIPFLNEQLLHTNPASIKEVGAAHD